ncbi:MAG: hypothetical protein HY954_01760 [Deltaproteobacteria bacterium]|nr:hypothetical protein [Deltaproteobacteria bacterium]
MEYDIIEQVAELCFSGARLDIKLARAAKLFLEYFPFDGCAIYAWDDGKKAFLKKAHEGEGPVIELYGEGEGLPGMAKRSNSPVFACKKNASGISWEGVDDEGIQGCRYAAVYPLKDKERLLGALYLKSRRKPNIPAGKRRVLGIAALQIAVLYRGAELIQGNEKAHRELIEAQELLVKSEKLMALGDMAATLAHEIKNPLISIGGFAGRLKKHIGADSPSHAYVEQMIKEAARLERLMDGVISFIKDSSVDLKSDDLNDIFTDALRFFDDEFQSHRIRVIRDFHPGGLRVLADREQLKIAFDNLIVNAIQSMEKGGTLELSTCSEGDSAIAKFIDTGGGIEPRNMGCIFNPFFTTKEHGTGLGLPITNSIIMRHRGVIEVDNNPGIGVVFKVILPLTKG